MNQPNILAMIKRQQIKQRRLYEAQMLIAKQSTCPVRA